ncbi:hypothetical protein HMPREF1981_00758 [Bacteroides pyogenes F0041]|uniref:Uncharacterized protein n=1 Tax=Bacteroides pyogenes F0041 TaxID=1321819 RepID=U2C8P0_9BACE|nr:hypothetical protein HMPREF1981_00758 [Bacteroides pyogenes F0041]
MFNIVANDEEVETAMTISSEDETTSFFDKKIISLPPDYS